VKHRIIVPEGMLSDIVRPLWEEKVSVTGIQTGTNIHLLDIQRARSDTDEVMAVDVV
jgi:hypothetical protein